MATKDVGTGNGCPLETVLWGAATGGGGDRRYDFVNSEVLYFLVNLSLFLNTELERCVYVFLSC